MSEIKTAVKAFTVNELALNATQDLTISGLGWTPKAAVLHITNVSSDDSATDHVRFSIGMAADDGGGGIDQRRVTIFSEDANASSNVKRRGATTSVARLSDSADNSTGIFSVDSFISNGLRIKELTSGTTGNIRVLIEFFGGADLKVFVNHDAMGTSTSNQAVTGVGFEPTFMRMAGMGDDLASTTDFNNLWQGFGYDTGAGMTAVSYCRSSSGDGDATPQCQTRIDSTHFGAQLSTTMGSLNHNYSLISFDTDGFTWKSSASAGNDDFIYLCLETGDRAVWAGTVDAPNSTGSDWSVTSPGFKPQIVGIIGSMADSNDTQDQGANGEVFGFGAFDANDEGSVSFYEEDGLSSNTNTGSMQSAKALRIQEPGKTDEFNLGSPTLESTGWKFTAANISAANSTVRKFVAYAIEEEAAAGGTTLLQMLNHTRYGGMRI